MTKMVYKDFDEFAAAINGVAGQFTPTKRSETDWWVQVVPVGRTAIQEVHIGGASTFEGDGTDNSITIGIPMTTSKRIHIDGNRLEDNSFILIKEGQPFTFASGRTTKWAGITVPMSHPALSAEHIDVLNGHAQRDKSSTLARTDLLHVAGARQLVARICAEEQDVVHMEAAAVLSMEQDIIALATHAIEASKRPMFRQTGRPPFCRQRVINRALEVMEAHRGRPLFIEELCRATQVSERTLRNVFYDYYDVGPMRLMKVRQLREIHAALMGAEPGEQRIATIASSFGIWDINSFTRNYKALYGETPSETLRRPPVARTRSRGMTARSFDQYEVRAAVAALS